MDVLLSVRDVHKAFGALQAVQGVSLDVRGGEVTAVIGPNGAGKTTLFNCISGALRADEAHITLSIPGGEVRIDALDMEAICLKGVARTFQQVRLFDTLSVLDNVVMGGLHRSAMGWAGAAADRLWHRRRRHHALRDEAMSVVRRVGLSSHCDQLAGNLDHGNRRRVEIARALASQPRVLLLDEPAAGMNPVETDALMTLLRELCQEGMGILLIEHDMKLVMQIATRVHVMDHGVPLSVGTPHEVTRDPRVIEAYLGNMGRRYAAG